jgi:hypothetical protein
MGFSGLVYQQKIIHLTADPYERWKDLPVSLPRACREKDTPVYPADVKKKSETLYRRIVMNLGVAVFVDCKHF